MLSSLSLTVVDFQEILCLVLGLVGIQSAGGGAVTKFSNASFGICISDVSWRLSNLFLTLTVSGLYISLLASENRSYHKNLPISYFCKGSSELLRKPFCDQKMFLPKWSILHIQKTCLSTSCFIEI